jgi:hypothetical protein
MIALTCLVTGFLVGHYEAGKTEQMDRLNWINQQKDPHLAALLISKEGRAGIKLAQLGVADLLLNCNGRSSWKIIEHYCVPMIEGDRADGFKISAAQ